MLAEKEASIVRVCLGVLVTLFVLVSLLGPFSQPSLPVQSVASPDLPSEIRVRLKTLGAGPWTLTAPARLNTPDGIILQEETVVTHDGTHILVANKVMGQTIQLFPTNGHLISLNHRPYPGYCSIHHRADYDEAVVIGHVATEVYVSHVLPAEMPLHYPEAALRAQSVAIRTYGLWQAARRQDRLWDVMDGQTSQVFIGGITTTASTAPVKATSRQVLMFQEELLPAYFSSVCGGATRSNQEAFGAVELPPLSGVNCNYCNWTRTRKWTVRIDAEEVRAALELSGPVIGIAVREMGNSGYDGDVLIETDNGEVPISTEAFRRKMGGGLKSSWFVGARLIGPAIEIKGRGFGHGVGLCQTGARGLAQLGRNYVELLAFYYPGARLVRLEKRAG